MLQSPSARVSVLPIDWPSHLVGLAPFVFSSIPEQRKDGSASVMTRTICWRNSARSGNVTIPRSDAHT
jgi:hypothetical protein